MFKHLEASKTLPARSPQNTAATARTSPSSDVSRCCDKSLVADRATVLLGCYRKGDANDPEVYTSAVIAVLARYPEEVVMAVTEPATGLPSRLKWLPAISELVEACEAAYAPIRRQIEREKVAFDRVRLLAPPPAGPKPTREEIEAVLGRKITPLKV